MLKDHEKRAKLDGLIEDLSTGKIGRRNFLKAGLALGLSSSLLLGIASDTRAEGKETGVIPVPEEVKKKIREEGNKLNIYNWSDYIDPGRYEKFGEEFGVEVTVDYFADAAEMLTKFQVNPEIGYDLTFPPIRTFIRMKEMNLLQELNHDWFPNVNKFMPERYKTAWYDPDYRYSVGYDFYTTGYTYNKKYVDQDDPRWPHWDLLFEGREYSGKMSMLKDPFHVVASALKYIGASINSTDKHELQIAEDILLRQKPWVPIYKGWPRAELLREEVVLSQQWGGDSWNVHSDNPDCFYSLPPEGAHQGVDLISIPKGSKHPATAHAFLNYIYRPKVRAQIHGYTGYAPTHTTALDYMSEDFREWFSYPEEVLARCEFVKVKAITGEGLKQRVAIWDKLQK